MGNVLRVLLAHLVPFLECGVAVKDARNAVLVEALGLAATEDLLFATVSLGKYAQDALLNAIADLALRASDVSSDARGLA